MHLVLQEQYVFGDSLNTHTKKNRLFSVTDLG